MDRNKARKLAMSVTNEQLRVMFDTARTQIKNWTQPSRVNKGISKGTAWNVLAKDFDVNANYHILAKTNMIREFWEYLPQEVLTSEKYLDIFSRKSHNAQPSPTHQEPNFEKYIK